MFSTCNHWFQAPLPPVPADRKVPCQYHSKIALIDCLHLMNHVLGSCEGCVEPGRYREGRYTSHQVHSDIILQSLGKDAKPS